eukprot:scaffold59136_cov59-Phaeocystis_antarctica.AAC.1
MLCPQPAVMVGARKGARDVWVGRLAQQPGARLAGHPLPTRLGQAVAACGATVRGACRMLVAYGARYMLVRTAQEPRHCHGCCGSTCQQEVATHRRRRAEGVSLAGECVAGVVVSEVIVRLRAPGVRECGGGGDVLRAGRVARHRLGGEGHVKPHVRSRAVIGRNCFRITDEPPAGTYAFLSQHNNKTTTAM